MSAANMNTPTAISPSNSAPTACNNTNITILGIDEQTVYTIAIDIQLVICSNGCILNLFLAYVIARNRSLRRNSCGVLIMLMALFDALAEFSLITLPTYLYLTQTQIRLIICFYVQFYATFVQVNSQNLMLLISLDRLMTVLSPINYVYVSKFRKKKLVGFTVSMISAITFLYNYKITHSEPENNPNKYVFCTTDDLVVGTDKDLYLWVNISQISGTFFCYLFIWCLLKFNILQNMLHEADRRIFKSLFILMGLIFFCYLPPQLLGKFVFPCAAQTGFYRLSRQLMKLAQTLNIAVLYYCSIDYRDAIKKELLICFRKQNSTTPVKSIHNSTPRLPQNNIMTTNI